MDFYDFEYLNKPFPVRSFQVHPLSNTGFNQYISGESYTHKFIDQIPNKKKEYKDIEISNTSNGKNYKYSYSPQKEAKDLFDNKNKYTNNDNDIIIANNQNHNTYNENNHNNNNKYVTENTNQTNKNNIENFNAQIIRNNLNLNEKNYNNTLYKNSKLINSDIKPKGIKGKNSLFSITTEKGFNFKKANLDPLSRRLNFTSSDFFKTTNNFNNFNNNNNNNNYNRYDKNYLKNVNLLIKSKSYLEMDKIKDNKERKYDGFQSYAIPNLYNTINNFEDNSENKRSPVFNMTEKMSKSCNGFKRNNVENLNENTKNKKKNAIEESEKLRKIMFLQTNTEFLKKNKMPEIQKFIDQPEIIINNNSIGVTKKNMGKKYNPFNYLSGRDCESRRRNVTGALFNH
jgi:hypothetical protein